MADPTATKIKVEIVKPNQQYAVGTVTELRAGYAKALVSQGIARYATEVTDLPEPQPPQPAGKWGGVSSSTMEEMAARTADSKEPDGGEA